MSEYIKREDALDVIEITPFEDYGDYIKAREIIENLPTIDVVPKDFHDKTCEAMAKRHTEEIQRLMPKRGEWKPFDLTWGRSIWYCTACEESTEVPCDIWEHKPIYKYCPNCGADMRKESER